MSERIQHIDEYHFVSPDISGHAVVSGEIVLDEGVPFHVALREDAQSLDEAQLQAYRRALQELSFTYQGPGGP